MATKDKTAGPTPDAEGAPMPETLPPEPVTDKATIEAWREIRVPDAWAHEAAKQLRNWPSGQVVSLADYDAAIKAAHSIEVS